jgi:hypothetical protein
MFFLVLAFVFGVTTVDWTSCSRTKYLVVLTILWAMNWTYVSIEVPMFLYTLVWIFTASFRIYASWAIHVIWWANSRAIGRFWTPIILIIL